MSKIHLNTLWPASVGFDRFIHEVEHMLNQTDAPTQFPPHNIIKVDDNKYIVELAVAGFSKGDITIKTIDGVLEIKGDKSNQDKDVQYLYKGIGTRTFIKKLQLAETVEVRGAAFKDGILTIGLENVIPEEKKPKVIPIDEELPSFKDEKQLLTE